MKKNLNPAQVFKYISDELEVLIDIRDFLKELHGQDCDPEKIINDIREIKNNSENMIIIYERMFNFQIDKAIAAIGLYIKLTKKFKDGNLLEPIKNFLQLENISDIILKNKASFVKAYDTISRDNLITDLKGLDLNLDIKVLDYPSYKEFLLINIKGSPEFVIQLKEESDNDESNKNYIEEYYLIHGVLPPEFRKPVAETILTMNNNTRNDTKVNLQDYSYR